MKRVLFAVLAACAPLPPPAPLVVQGAPGSQDPPPGEDPNSGTVECHDEAITGSTISHTVCRTKEGAHDSRNQDTMVRQLETPRVAPPCCP